MASLYFLLSKFMLVLMNPIGKTIAQQVTLAVGAGIYEEFLFRVMLISGLTGIIGFVFLWGERARKIAALIIARHIFRFSLCGGLWRLFFYGIISLTILCRYYTWSFILFQRIWYNGICS